MIRQQQQRQEDENGDANQHVAETKPSIASSKLPLFPIRLMCLRKELRDMLRLELAQGTPTVVSAAKQAPFAESEWPAERLKRNLRRHSSFSRIDPIHRPILSNARASF